MSIVRYRVESQPKIPSGVTDLITRSEAGGKIWHIHSEGQGVTRWATIRLRWGMGREMVEESKPHAIEYWREVCPHWREGVLVQLVYNIHDGWQWVVEDGRFIIAPEELPRVGDKYRKFGKDLVHIRAIVDDQVVYRIWDRHRWRYECADDWAFKHIYPYYVKEGEEHAESKEG